MAKERISFNNFDQELDRTDYEVLSRLADHDDFKTWRKMVETFQMKRAVNLLRGIDLPEDIDDPLTYYRGGHDMYIKMMRTVDMADTILQQYADETTN